MMIRLFDLFSEYIGLHQIDQQTTNQEFYDCRLQVKDNLLYNLLIDMIYYSILLNSELYVTVQQCFQCLIEVLSY